MKPNITVQIFSFLLMGLIVLTVVFEPWNRMVDQLDIRLRRSFFGYEKSHTIEREMTNTVRDLYASISPENEPMPAFLTRMPDFYRIQVWASDMEERIIYRSYRILCRIESILCLFPVVMLMFTIPLMDAMLGRRIKQMRFDYPSPLLHRFSSFLFSVLAGIFTLLIFTPVPFAPEEAVVTALLSGLILKMYLLHLPKRL